MSIKDTIWHIARPVARTILPHWHGSACTLTATEAEGIIRASTYMPHALFGAEVFPASLPTLLPDALDLSIIVPVYNAESFLEKCIGSLATQNTKHRYEIIAVNDGSTDHSAEILELLAQKYTRLKIMVQDNAGIGAARNAGLVHASGHFVSFVDNDDFVAPWFVDTLLAKAKSENADMVKCGYRIFDCSTNSVAGQVQNEDAVLHDEMGVFAARYNGFVWGCVFRRALFADMRFPADFWYEDMVTRLLLMRKSRCFVSVRAALYTHTEHARNASKTVWGNGNVKNLDQFFLAEALARYGESIGLGGDNGLYPVLLEEFGTQLRTRTGGIAEPLRKAVFVLACQCLDGYRAQNTSALTPREALLDDAFACRSYRKWALVCLL